MAWNQDAARLFTGWLDREQDGAAPNQLRFMFREASARLLIADWPERARRLVAEFRADAGRHADQPPLSVLIDELIQASAEFRQCWETQQVLGRDGGVRRFQHALSGAVDFHQVTLHLARRHELKLVMLLPIGG